MVILLIVIVVLSITPSWIIWTKRLRFLSVKILLSLLSLLIAIFMMSACVKLSDTEDLANSMMERNQNYVNCIDTSETEEDYGYCIRTNLEDLYSIY
jgi:hypothetical protein